MKKIICTVLALVMLFGLSSEAFAANSGIMPIIRSKETQGLVKPELELPKLKKQDNLKIDDPVNIEGCGILTLTEFQFVDSINQYCPNNGLFIWSDPIKSGQEADYAILRVDITNTTTESKDYLSEISVKAIYDGIYEYNGWAYQSDFNNSSPENAIARSDQFAIDPMFEGHYIFGCTLPNAVVNGKKPLKMILTTDDSEMIYIIRK